VVDWSSFQFWVGGRGKHPRQWHSKWRSKPALSKGISKLHKWLSQSSIYLHPHSWGALPVRVCLVSAVGGGGVDKASHTPLSNVLHSECKDPWTLSCTHTRTPHTYIVGWTNHTAAVVNNNDREVREWWVKTLARQRHIIAAYLRNDFFDKEGWILIESMKVDRRVEYIYV
jgi:hypothetical protein